MFKRIIYDSDPLDGIVKHIKEISGKDDIVAEKYVSFIVPSFLKQVDIQSHDPKVLFEIESPNYEYFWSTSLNEEYKFIFLAFKYSIQLEGIGIINYCIDWYKKYKITASNDLIEWIYNEEFDTTNKNIQADSKDKFYFSLPLSKPVKYINITPYNSNEKDNFAFYGIEFFGTIINPNKLCTNENSFFLNFNYRFYLLCILLL